MFSDLVADDLPLHGHTEAGERAVADRAGDDGLAAFCLCQLVRVDLSAIQGLCGEEPHMAVPAGDDGQQLLLGDQVDMVHFLIVSHPDYF